MNVAFNNIKIPIRLRAVGGQQMSFQMCPTVANKKVNDKKIYIYDNTSKHNEICYR